MSKKMFNYSITTVMPSKLIIYLIFFKKESEIRIIFKFYDLLTLIVY